MKRKRKGVLSRLLNNSFVKSVILIASGTAGAQAIGMLAMPFITRLYGPEAFGALGAFTALATAVIPIAALTYPIAIVLAKTDQEAQEIGGMSLIISSLFACLILLLIIFFGEQLSVLLKLQEIGHFIYLIPLVMVFSVLLQIARQWAIRKQDYRRIANTAIAQAVVVNGSKLVIGLFHPVAIVLITTYVFGQLFQAMLLLFKESVVLFKVTFNLSWRRCKVIAKKYYDFPLFRAPQVALNAFSESMPVLFFTVLYGPAAAGYYSLARVALGIPAALIGQSVSDVFYPRFVKADQDGAPKRPLLLKATIGLIAIGFFPYLFVFIFGPWLFSFVFGVDWQMAGEFARWLSFWLFATLFTRPVIAAIPVLKMQSFFLIFECVALIARAGAIYLGYIQSNEAASSVVFLGVSNFFIYSLLLIYVFNKSEEKLQDNRKKKIAFFIPSLNGGGAERMMVNKANYLSQQGYLVDLILIRKEGPYLPLVDPQVNIIDLKSSRAATSIFKLISYFKKDTPDVILSALTHINILTVIAKVFSRKNIKVVVSQRNMYSPKLGRGVLNKLMHALAICCYKKADAVIAISDGVKESLVNSLNMKPDSINTIYNPAYSLESVELSYEKPSHYWFSLGTPVILSVARLEEVKDFSTLIKAFALLRKEINAKLIILGEGSERGKLESLINKMELQNDVDLVGFVDNPHAYMRAADLFVLSSKREGFGNVIVEAMACGTPVVSTNCSGPKEVLEDGKWGRLVPVSDISALADAMKESLKHPSSVDVTERAKAFSVEKIAQEYLAVLEP